MRLPNPLAAYRRWKSWREYERDMRALDDLEEIIRNPRAAWWRDMAEGVRLLPSAMREVLRGECFRILERRARANVDFWQAHTGALWAMAITIGVLWCLALLVFRVT